MSKPAKQLDLPTEIELQQMIAKQAAAGRPIFGSDGRKTSQRPPSEKRPAPQKRPANADANA